MPKAVILTYMIYSAGPPSTLQMFYFTITLLQCLNNGKATEERVTLDLSSTSQLHTPLIHWGKRNEVVITCLLPCPLYMESIERANKGTPVGSWCVWASQDGSNKSHIHTRILYLHTHSAIWAYQISETEQGSTLSKLEATSSKTLIR